MRSPASRRRKAHGTKRFSVLPPGAHRGLRLHPRWHGSVRQSQAHLPGLAAGLEQQAWVVTLRAGDALYLPPLWLHYAESLSENVRAQTPPCLNTPCTIPY